MRISCPSCQTAYNVDDARLPKRGGKMKCAKCQAIFPLPLPQESTKAAFFSPAPAPPSEDRVSAKIKAIPLPGFGDVEEPTAQNDFPTLNEGASPKPLSSSLEGFDFHSPPKPPPSELEVPFSAPGQDLSEPEASSPPWGNESTKSTPNMIPLEAFPLPVDEFQAVPLPGLELGPLEKAAAGAVSQPSSSVATSLESPSPSPPQEFLVTAHNAGESEDFPAALTAAPNFEWNAGPPEFEAPASEHSELLDFLENPLPGATSPAPALQSASAYYLRNAEGASLGEHEEHDLLTMLAEGQLSGSEEISKDKSTWIPLTSLTQNTLSPPADSGFSVDPPSEPKSEPNRERPRPSLDRLKKMYDGRTAAVAAGQGESTRARLKRWAPWLVGAVALLAFLSAGLGAGLSTHYGYFWLKYLFPAKVPKGSPEAADLAKARQQLEADTYQGYVKAQEAAVSAMSSTEYPEARALWIQAVFYLQRKYGAAEEGAVREASEKMKSVELLGTSHPDVLKAQVGEKLAQKAADDALALLAANPDVSDLELSMLTAEALVQKGNRPQALDILDQVLTQAPKSAKALHAKGQILASEGQAEQAVALFEKALAAQPTHLSSALALASVELLLRGNNEKALDILERASEKKFRSLFSPQELAQTHTLKGEVLLRQRRAPEAIELFDLALKVDGRFGAARAGLGKVFLMRREYEKALIHYQAATQLDPNNVELTSGHLTCLIALGKMVDAAKVVEAANTRFQGNAQIAYLNGRFADALDKTQEAEKHYRRAIQTDPNLAEAVLYLTRLHLRFRRLAEARELLKSVAAQVHEQSLLQTAQGEVALFENNLEEATEAFNRATQLDPYSPEAHLGLSRVALEKGDLAVAEESVDAALALDPSVKGGHLQRGLVLWKQGQLDGAIAELDEAKVSDPSSSQVLIEIGAIKLEKGDFIGAEASLSAALAQSGVDATAYFHLARVQSRKAQHASAIESMKRALEFSPKRVDFHYELGRILRDAGKIDEAIEAWTVVTQMAPNRVDAHEALGLAYLEKNRIADAIAAFQATLKVAPQLHRIHASLGDCHFADSQWDEAIALYTKALKLEPSLIQLPYKIARAYSEKGTHAQAIEWYKKAVVADASNIISWYYLGYAYKEKGRRKEAISAFSVYLRKKPNAEERKMLEDEIYDLQHER